MTYYKFKNKLKKIKAINKTIKQIKSYKLKKENKKRNLIFQEKGNALSIEISEILEKSGINYFYTYGNLLGIVREGKFIGHDNDLDLGIIESSDFNWKDLDNILNKIGMKRIHEFELDGKITEITYEKAKGLSVDFFLYSFDEDKMYSYCYHRFDEIEYCNKNEYTPMKMYLTPIKSTEIYKTDTNTYRIPMNAENYLEEVYGKDWKIPNPNWRPYGSHLWIKYTDKKANLITYEV